jgi:pimeloyl-ACP methyl ester carboxylesterase
LDVNPLKTEGLSDVQDLDHNLLVFDTRIQKALKSPKPFNISFMFILFLPGSFRRSSDYHWLSTCLADNGDYYFVDYPLSSSVAKLNSEFFDSDALLQVRREFIYGSDSQLNSKLGIAYEESIMGTFLTQVRQQHGFHLVERDILLQTLVVGHSQGAGHAALMAIDFELCGVLLIAGPADSYQQFPSEWTRMKIATPSSRLRMFIHAEDRHARMCLHHATMLGLNRISVLTSSTSLEDILLSQVVIDTRPLPPLKSHDCLTFDSDKRDDFNKLYLSGVLGQYQMLLRSATSRHALTPVNSIPAS